MSTLSNLESQVSIDSNCGVARLGATTVEIVSAGYAGEIRIGGQGGPVLRPLEFGERNRIVVRALGSAKGWLSVCTGIVTAATVTPGEYDPLPVEILALTLAGAALEAPEFAETTLLVARATGWKPAELAETEAAEVDRLAMRLAAPAEESGWNRLVFAPAGGDGLETLREELANNLLARARASSIVSDGSALSLGSRKVEPIAPTGSLLPNAIERREGHEPDQGDPRGIPDPNSPRPAQDRSEPIRSSQHRPTASPTEVNKTRREEGFAPLANGRELPVVQPGSQDRYPIPGEEVTPDLRRTTVAPPGTGGNPDRFRFDREPQPEVNLRSAAQEPFAMSFPTRRSTAVPAGTTPVTESESFTAVLTQPQVTAVWPDMPQPVAQPAWPQFEHPSSPLQEVRQAGLEEGFRYGTDVMGEADALAAVLSLEADLRGLER